LLSQIAAEHVLRVHVATDPRAMAAFNTNPLMRRMLAPANSLTQLGRTLRRWPLSRTGGTELLAEDVRILFRGLR
jgi:hypothetical protein